MTVCRVQRNNAEARLRAILDDKPDPALLAQNDATQELPTSVATADDETSYVDLAGVAEDAIRRKIDTVFKGHKLATLVGAILETQGYRIVVSPPGADGGADIIAGMGPLGFDRPRLVVQVKSQSSAIDVTVLRELQGVMRQFGAEQGLLVAWEGSPSLLPKKHSVFSSKFESGTQLKWFVSFRKVMKNYQRIYKLTCP